MNFRVLIYLFISLFISCFFGGSYCILRTPANPTEKSKSRPVLNGFDHFIYIQNDYAFEYCNSVLKVNF